MSKTTIAAEIAAKFSNDGEMFENKKGEHIEILCSQATAGYDEMVLQGDTIRKYVFSDDSCIILYGAFWDFGHGDLEGCFCPTQDAHAVDCPHADTGIHITEIKNSTDVWGHPVKFCNPCGCAAGADRYYPEIRPGDCNVDDIYYPA
jgi:hypothetical protein